MRTLGYFVATSAVPPVAIHVLPDRRHTTALTMMQDSLDPTFMRVVGFASGRGRER